MEKRPAGGNVTPAKKEEHGINQQTVYSFTFSKYSPSGRAELEIEGDSADIFAKVVNLTNVIAKAYAQDTPITITADNGVFDRETSNVNLKNNVIATSEEGVTFKSNSLRIDVKNKVLSTEDKARIEKDNVSIKGEGAVGDSNEKRLKFKKNVTVVITVEGGEPTTITCDGQLEVDYVNSIAHFNKNVVAKDSKGKLTADYMDVFYDKNSRKVSKIVARGNVVIEQGENKTYSDNVIYLADEGKIILGGASEAVYKPQNKTEVSASDDGNNDPFEFLETSFK